MVRKHKKTQMTTARNEDITKGSTHMKRVIKAYHEQLYANKFYNLDEMNKFLGIYKLAKLSQKTNDLNDTVSIKETDFVVQNPPTKKAAVRRTFLMKSMIPTDQRLSGHPKRRGTSNLCQEDRTTQTHPDIV